MKHLPLYNQHYEHLYSDFERAVKAQGYGGEEGCTFHYQSREFLFFLETKGINTIQEVKPSHIIDYYEYLQQRPNQRREGGLSDSMLRKQLYCLRTFFDHLIDTGTIISSPAHLPKFGIHPYKEREPLSTEEIQHLYRAAIKKIDKAILGLAYGCGLRRSEIARLNVNDIQFHQGILTVRKGKFGKSRTVPISNTVLRDLKEYIIHERPKKLRSTITNTNQEPAMLLSKYGTRMHPLTIHFHLKQLILNTHNRILIQKNIGLHHLRHSIATHLLDNGADIEFVREFLGHVHLDTTHLYSKKRKRKKLLQQAFEHYDKIKTNNTNPA